ncbi:uncharacterized protein LOC129925308 [Biomphalaria glabrata]|uniref:Uncharacterized protein LOC129925308 n=1 Tax=Biomphalaria glabrata TaxID=6526 RepID=A0A9W3A115_BIOGL|nr:uncharacterized protein LOC129925308 [Biomphalaria glabrata]XP_055880869.1 uncharacterized protein LOC129925308 [Biomphalaria glabrata]XP_055880870.1 uncharacterized protein LOC129925308 [Biomphalaria glabrata]XP_055880871.1 uncharacterized protein LOC129925308 [Biomphalaria glabrata]XP_055880872.1 uncharacterized protein LOC129925308 [Biomphalaria glabrata]
MDTWTLKSSYFLLCYLLATEGSQATNNGIEIIPQEQPTNRIAPNPEVSSTAHVRDQHNQWQVTSRSSGRVFRPPESHVKPDYVSIHRERTNAPFTLQSEMSSVYPFIDATRAMDYFDTYDSRPRPKRWPLKILLDTEQTTAVDEGHEKLGDIRDNDHGAIKNMNENLSILNPSAGDKLSETIVLQKGGSISEDLMHLTSHPTTASMQGPKLVPGRKNKNQNRKKRKNPSAKQLGVGLQSKFTFDVHQSLGLEKSLSPSSSTQPRLNKTRNIHRNQGKGKKVRKQSKKRTSKTATPSEQTTWLSTPILAVSATSDKKPNGSSLRHPELTTQTYMAEKISLSFTSIKPHLTKNPEEQTLAAESVVGNSGEHPAEMLSNTSTTAPEPHVSDQVSPQGENRWRSENLSADIPPNTQQVSLISTNSSEIRDEFLPSQDFKSDLSNRSDQGQQNFVSGNQSLDLTQPTRQPNVDLKLVNMSDTSFLERDATSTRTQEKVTHVYKNAYDFLSSQTGLIRRQRPRKFDAFHQEFSERMCALFGKKFVRTPIGGKCE